MKSRSWLLLLVLLAGIAAPPALAVDLPGVPAPPATDKPPEKPSDKLGRETPEAMVTGLLRALGAQNYRQAAEYLNVDGVPQWQRRAGGPELAKIPQQVLDQAGWVEGRWQLSDKATGNEDDKLPPGTDRFGAVRTSSGNVDLLAERVEGRAPVPIWLVSAATLARLPYLVSTAVNGPLERILPAPLQDRRLFGAPVGHWLALLVLAGLAYGVAWCVSSAIRWVAKRLLQRLHHESWLGLVQAGDWPLRVLMAVGLFVVGAFALGVSIVARQRAGVAAEIAAWTALVWLAWRLVNAATTAGSMRAASKGHFAALSVLSLLRRTAKVALVALAVILALSSLGVDVTAGLAALGIGGLAIALGAQKLMENFIGSLTIIADQPIRVGDVCKFGDTLGTVEDIGIRSSRIRTLERTLVTVPNSVMASASIENYTNRDRFWFHPQLTLRYETTPDQMRFVLVRLREMLYAHPCVSPDPARVRFTGFGADTLNIDVFAYVLVANYDEFLEVQEDLSLRIMDLVQESGAAFAFPSRTLYLGRDPKPDEAATRSAEDRVRQWAEEGRLPLPRFPPERIAELRDTIHYKPDGAEALSRADGSRPPPPGR